MKKIWIIIVTFNEEEKVIECLNSLVDCVLTNLKCDLRILIIDNNSTNDTLKKIKNLKIKKLEIIKNQTNLGFSAACNIGIKNAFKNKADYILLLNPDTKVTKNFLKPLLDTIRRPEVGICGPKTLLCSSPRRSPFGHLRGVSDSRRASIVWSAGGVIDPKRFSGGLIGYGEEDKGQYDKEKEVDYISGTCMLVKRKVFEKIGLLKEDFFLYYDDVDFCYRARKAGFQIRYVPASVIYHYGSYTIGKSSQMMQYYLARNRLYFLEKQAPLIIRLREMVRLPKTIWEHLKQGETAALAGIRDYFLRRVSLGGPTSSRSSTEVGPRLESCRFCRTTTSKIFLNGKDFQLLKCQNCGIIFTSPLSSKEALEVANKRRYGQENLSRDYFLRFSSLLKKAEKIIQEIKKFKKRGRFLDIGCGFGVLLKAAKGQGFEVLGVEKEEKTAETAKKKLHLEVLAKEFSKIELPSAFFDIVTCFDVLEHIKKPIRFLKKIKKHLKKDGLLVVQTPNIESLMFYLTRQKWNWLLLPNHLWHFSPKTLSAILRNGGFKILKLETVDDLSEFNFNLIDALDVKKSDFLSKVVWKILRIGFFGIAPLSFLWSKLGKGGLIRIYAQNS